MKKIFTILGLIINLIYLQITSLSIIAEESNPVRDAFGVIQLPNDLKNIGFGNIGISNFLNKTIELIYLIAWILFLFMIIASALQWILSGGDKEAVGKARGRLTYAIIGIAILSLAFLIANTVGTFLGFNFF